MIVATRQAGGLPSRTRQETREFRLILAVTFPVFLVAATAARLLPTQWRTAASRATRRRSIVAEARAAAYAAIPLAFMG